MLCVKGITGIYDVHISVAPSCTCNFYNSRKKVVCKHIIWVMLFQLRVQENNSILQQVALTEEEVKTLLKQNSPTASASVNVDYESSKHRQEQKVNSGQGATSTSKTKTTCHYHLTEVEKLSIFEANEARHSPNSSS